MIKRKIKLKRTDGSVIFEYKDKDNSVKKTLEAYINRERKREDEFVNLQHINLHGTDLREIDLSWVNLKYADLSYSNLSKASLYCANLEYANLRFSDLTEADLRDSSLGDADLRFSDLTEVDLRDSHLECANLKDADLTETKLSGAYLNNVILISARNIQHASCYFTGHGERGRQLLAIKINDETMLFCGCFKGNESELRTYIEEGDEKYKASRLIALDTVLKLIEL